LRLKVNRQRSSIRHAEDATPLGFWFAKVILSITARSVPCGQCRWWGWAFQIECRSVASARIASRWAAVKVGGYGGALVVAGKPAGLGQRASQSRSSCRIRDKTIDHGGQAASQRRSSKADTPHSSRNDL
jgi:hypothetical protein